MAATGRVRVSVDGAEEIDATLGKINIHLRRVLLGKAVRKAAREAARDARRRAPTGSGDEGDPTFPNLKKSIKSKLKQYDEVVVGIIGATTQAQQAHLVEFGHRLVRGGSIESGGRVRKTVDPSRKGKGEVIGEVAPSPFMRPSFDAMRPRIEAILITELKKLTAAFAT